MGEKLGIGFMVYGILNLIGSVIILAAMPGIGLAGIVWSIIFIAIGHWMRGNAKKNTARDALILKQSEALGRIMDKLGGATKVEEEKPSGGIRYIKD